VKHDWREFIFKISAPTLFFLILLCTPGRLFAEGLKNYLEKSDDNFTWKEISQETYGNGTLFDLELVSQNWRNILWKHHVILLIPNKRVNEKLCFLFVGSSSDGRKELDLVSEIANNSHIAAAVVSSIPNQPLFDGLKENALLAFTFKKFIESGDESWPILFPMVKAVERSMDVISSKSENSLKKKIDSFIVSGGSKRGWTTWLVAAVDKRVKAIAPMVFDMLNMRKHIELAEKSYGKQSEKIKDFTDLGLVERIDEPLTSVLRRWIDPFEYRNELSLPKLILLGTNDPYWVVDAQSLYFSELSGPKLLYQVPNGDHHISSSPELRKVLSTWIGIIANGGVLPEVKWRSEKGPKGELQIHLESKQDIVSGKVWKATSERRDFREASWSEFENVSSNTGGMALNFSYTAPDKGFAAYLIELTVRISPILTMSVSSEVFVMP